MGNSQKFYKKAKLLIPGGTQLLSKRPEMILPNYWPTYYSKAKGCHVWDLDGNKYCDTSYMGIGANILGYSDDDVDVAVKYAVDNGSMCTLNSPEEVELAELLLDIHNWADQVRYARTGGEAVAIAVRIARAATGKDLILFCGYHGWSDWYLSANLNEDSSLDGHLLSGLEPNGVPRGLTGTAFPFEYNNLDSFNSLVKKYFGKIAAVVMEPIRNDYPQNDFLKKIRETTFREKIVLIFDEVSAGFRLNCGGSHLTLGVEPDIITLGKALSNGYPMSAIIGKKEIMSAAESTFISSTYWTERIGPSASIASIKKFQKFKVEEHLNKIGRMVQEGWETCAKKNKVNIHISGIFPLGHFDFLYENPLLYKTLFTQEMLKRGFLSVNAFYVSYAHTECIVNDYLNAVDDVFHFIRDAINNNCVETKLNGPICHAGFQRLT